MLFILLKEQHKMKINLPLLKTKKLIKYFPIRKGLLHIKPIQAVRAVDGVSFSVSEKETLGIVGESGCGKSTLARVILKLIEPTAGRIIFEGEDITDLGKKDMRKYRRELQIIFQNPYASLDPRKRIKETIGEAFYIHGYKREEIHLEVSYLLDKVGLTKEQGDRYPHELSGGQQQRVDIAKALALRPKLIIADEPTSSLDVSIQAQILNLLQDLQEELSLTYIFISHDIKVVNYISDRIAVMYLGKIIEIGKSEIICNTPLHPYTLGLISALPGKAKKDSYRVSLKGELSSSISPPSGCRFHPRCGKAKNICQNKEPSLKEVEKNHWVACFRHSICIT